MKCRHAAAIALVGWYLMVPPVKYAPTSKPDLLAVDPSAPLSKWSVSESFDTAAECEARKDQRFETFRKAMEPSAFLKFYDGPKGALLQGQCIATDDPRLSAIGHPAV
jgi:hypothetical protein